MLVEIFWLLVMSKIQIIESKSQQRVADLIDRVAVSDVKDTNYWKQITTVENVSNNGGEAVSDVKDTNYWKQITTIKSMGIFITMLLVMSKIQIIESKSQQHSHIGGLAGCC